MRPSRLAPLCFAGLIAACTTFKLPLDLQARVDAAPIGAEVLVPAGTWSGDLVVRRPVVIRGAGLEKTTLSGTRTVVILSPGVTLEGLTVIGSEAPLRVAAHAGLTARRLRVEGPGKALQVEDGGSLESEDLQADCHKGGLAGVHVSAGRWVGRRIAVTGACRRGVELANADADLSHLSILGARDAGLHALISTLKATDISVDSLDKAAPAIFEARSKFDLNQVRINGGEEALLFRGGDTRVDGLTVTRTSASAFAGVGGTHVLSHVRATGPFQQAALSALVECHLTASDIQVSNTGATGLLAVRSHVDVEQMSVDAVRSDNDGDNGHGLTFNRSTGKIRQLRVTHADGSVVYASGADAAVDVDGADGDKVSSGVMLALGARARVRHLKVTNAPLGLVATGSSHLQVADSRFETLVGVLVCAGSTVAEQEGVTIQADLRQRTCEDNKLGEAWNQILDRP